MSEVNDRYVLVKDLGDFGFGRIKVWFDKTRNRKIVSKELVSVNYENCRRLIEEGRMYIALGPNRHVVDLLDYRFNYTDPCLVLPYYETNLQTWIGKTNWYDALAVVKHCSLALLGIRALGADHRDIKPGNMYLDKDPQGWFIRLGDLGLGRLPRPILDNNLTYNAYGTFGYKAWELYQPNARFTPECDICSLGISAIELITGSRDRNSINAAWINNDAKNLFLAMTSFNPRERPSAQQIIATADTITQSYRKKVDTTVKWGLGLAAAALLIGALGE